MKRPFLFGGILVSGLAVTGALCGPGGVSELFGQGKNGRQNQGPSPAQVRALELREKKAREQFLRDTAQLAKDYEEAGLLEKAKSLLKTVQRIDSNISGVKEKLGEIEERILASNPFQFDVDTAGGWGEPIARVQKDKPVRILAKGSYRFAVQETIGPTGFPTDDPVKQMTKGIATGALMAIVIPLDEKGKPGKPGKPIEIGENKEITPKKSGYLFLTVNAPKGNRNIGKITVQLSGYVAPAT